MFLNKYLSNGFVDKFFADSDFHEKASIKSYDTYFLVRFSTGFNPAGEKKLYIFYFDRIKISPDKVTRIK